eukprot:5448113-Alexandrium_andersonii.AAC.1
MQACARFCQASTESGRKRRVLMFARMPAPTLLVRCLVPCCAAAVMAGPCCRRRRPALSRMRWRV